MQFIKQMQKLFLIGCVGAFSLASFAQEIDPCEQIAGLWHGTWRQASTLNTNCVWQTEANISRYKKVVSVDVRLTNGVDNLGHQCRDDFFILSGRCKDARLDIVGGGVDLMGSVIGNIIGLDQSTRGVWVRLYR